MMVASVEPTVTAKVHDQIRLAVNPHRVHFFDNEDRRRDLTGSPWPGRSAPSPRFAAAPAACRACRTAQRSRPGLRQIDRIVVVFLENRSFDNMFGLFPGANGLAGRAPRRPIQVDREAALSGAAARHGHSRKPPAPDPRFPPKPAKPAVSDRRVRPPARQGPRPRPPLVPAAGADQWRPNGQVRRVLGCRRPGDGLPRHQ